MADTLERRHSDEKLASQLAAFGLLGRTNVSGSAKPAPSLNPICPGGPRRSYCNGGVRPCSVKPVYLEVEGFRGWICQTEPGRVRLNPVRPTGSDRLTAGIGFSGRETGCCQLVPVRSKPGLFENEPKVVRFVPVRVLPGSDRKSGGTGVFLPRLAVKDEVNKRNHMKGRVQKKQLNNHKQKKDPTQVDGTEQMGPTCQPNTELGSGLPHEWSY